MDLLIYDSNGKSTSIVGCEDLKAGLEYFKTAKPDSTIDEAYAFDHDKGKKSETPIDISDIDM